jgi:hypothetical protein
MQRVIESLKNGLGPCESHLDDVVNLVNHLHLLAAVLLSDLALVRVVRPSPAAAQARTNERKPGWTASNRVGNRNDWLTEPILQTKPGALVTGFLANQRRQARSVAPKHNKANPTHQCGPQRDRKMAGRARTGEICGPNTWIRCQLLTGCSCSCPRRQGGMNSGRCPQCREQSPRCSRQSADHIAREQKQSEA